MRRVEAGEPVESPESRGHLEAAACPLGRVEAGELVMRSGGSTEEAS